MIQEKIDRINELYRKSKAEGLTEAEKNEQAILRKEFIASIKKNVQSQLNNIDMVNEDGTIEKEEWLENFIELTARIPGTFDETGNATTRTLSLLKEFIV